MCYECKKLEHMRGKCPELQKKFTDKFKKCKAMVATWSDEESDSSQKSEDQMANICLMAHEDDSSEVNSKLDTIIIEHQEALYENIYTNYKKLKHENKSLKTKNC